MKDLKSLTKFLNLTCQAFNKETEQRKKQDALYQIYETVIKTTKREDVSDILSTFYTVAPEFENYLEEEKKDVIAIYQKKLQLEKEYEDNEKIREIVEKKLVKADKKFYKTSFRKNNREKAYIDQEDFRFKVLDTMIEQAKTEDELYEQWEENQMFFVNMQEVALNHLCIKNPCFAKYLDTLYDQETREEIEKAKQMEKRNDQIQKELERMDQYLPEKYRGNLEQRELFQKRKQEQEEDFRRRLRVEEQRRNNYYYTSSSCSSGGGYGRSC